MSTLSFKCVIWPRVIWLIDVWQTVVALKQTDDIKMFFEGVIFLTKKMIKVPRHSV